MKPVYPEYFADPFVWRDGSTYYAVGTGNLGIFSILSSPDLKDWEVVGPAMPVLDAEFGDSYWAPEVAFNEGRWWMYYSVGRGDKMHHLRVAVADSPGGPYSDCNVRLTDPFRCPFAIDASPFQDDDGAWYLFYAVDFLDENNDSRTGTGVVCDRMKSMTELAGEPRVVVRARHAWQMFLANRVMYGSRYDWHTIEGPCVRKRNGRYWCLYSAGCWNSDSYGVDYAVADSVAGPWSDAGNESGPRVLKTVRGDRIGPGHNSIVTDPAGQDFIAYHAWDPEMKARRMFIERLQWNAEGPRCSGNLVE